MLTFYYLYRILKLLNFKKILMNECLLVCISVHQLCFQCPWRPEEALELQTVVSMPCAMSCTKLNPGPLGEQLKAVITEPFLQPLIFFILNRMISIFSQNFIQLVVKFAYQCSHVLQYVNVFLLLILESIRLFTLV